jgi:hypothetical protein
MQVRSLPIAHQTTDLLFFAWPEPASYVSESSRSGSTSAHQYHAIRVDMPLVMTSITSFLSPESTADSQANDSMLSGCHVLVPDLSSSYIVEAVVA